jgi:membrane-bound inhibitor of C-type lysozyme
MLKTPNASLLICLAAIALLTAIPVHAAVQVRTVRYVCRGGARLVASYWLDNATATYGNTKYVMRRPRGSQSQRYSNGTVYWLVEGERGTLGREAGGYIAVDCKETK